MSALHHLLRRCAGAIALVLACAVLVGSLCPRGWFVCVHEHDLVLVGGGHVHEQSDCPDVDYCPADGAGGCLDLALSLVLDDQTTALPVRNVLPAGAVLAMLPDLIVAAQSAWLPLDANLAEPPSALFVYHIRLMV